MRHETLTHRTAILLAALPALAGAVLLAAQARPGAGPTGAASQVAAGAPPAVHVRMLCSLSNEDAAAARVRGADGGQSVVVDGRSWWLFGDTLFLPDAGKQIEPNTIASSSGRDASSCPTLRYHAEDGIAVPFLPKDGALTSWPSGAIAASGGAIDFYTAYVYGSGPYAYWIGEIGLARLDTASMGTTVVERSLWARDSGFASQVMGAAPIDERAGFLRVALELHDGTKLLSRVPRAAMADRDAYEYWDGAGWTRERLRAAALWPVAYPDDPVQRLATFETSASIAWNDALGQYVALTNGGFAAVVARTADRLEGPWSAPQPWIDCSAFAADAVPVCYSPLQHAQFASADGRTLFVTLTRLSTYDVVALEVTLGTPVYERASEAGVEYGTDAGPGTSPAFHASDAPLPGFVPVFRWGRDAETQYAAASPGEGYVRGEAAFFAPPATTVEGSLTAYRPVYAWHRGETHVLSPLTVGLEADGFERGGVAFYAP